MPAAPAPLDCLIIGAGAAGLTAATYLTRFRRRIQVVDGGASRLLSIPTSHNYPGFAGGIHGHDILTRLREQTARYGTMLVTGHVERLDKCEDGSFVAAGGAAQWQARTVILATGVVDIAPTALDVRPAVAAGCVRYCPICDGFEAIGKRTAVIGNGKSGLGESLFVAHFAESVTLLTLDAPLALTPEEQARLDTTRVKAVSEPIAQLAFDGAEAMHVLLRDGRTERFDVVYLALGTQVNSDLARRLGAASTPNGELLVDAHQQTAVDGLYAAGDVVSGLNQITVAMGQAAIAATAIHNRLRA